MNFYVGGPLFVVFFLALGIALSLEQPTAPESAQQRSAPLSRPGQRAGT